MQEEKKSDEQHQINLFIIYAAMAWKFKRNQCWLKLWSALDRFASYTEKKTCWMLRKRTMRQLAAMLTKRNLCSNIN